MDVIITITIFLTILAAIDYLIANSKSLQSLIVVLITGATIATLPTLVIQARPISLIFLIPVVIFAIREYCLHKQAKGTAKKDYEKEIRELLK